MLFGQVTINQNKNPRIRTLKISKLLYTGCSGKSNQNKNPSIRTLNISELPYKGCFAKDATTLFFPRSTWNFKKGDFYTFSLSKQLRNKNFKKIIRIAYILKLLHTGCSTNKAIALLISQAFDKSIKIVPINPPESSSFCHFCKSLKRACCVEYALRNPHSSWLRKCTMYS